MANIRRLQMKEIRKENYSGIVKVFVKNAEVLEAIKDLLNMDEGYSFIKIDSISIAHGIKMYTDAGYFGYLLNKSSDAVCEVLDRSIFKNDIRMVDQYLI